MAPSRGGSSGRGGRGGGLWYLAIFVVAMVCVFVTSRLKISNLVGCDDRTARVFSERKSERENVSDVKNGVNSLGNSDSTQGNGNSLKSSLVVSDSVAKNGLAKSELAKNNPSLAANNIDTKEEKTLSSSRSRDAQKLFPPTTVCLRGCSETEQIAPLNHWHSTTGGFLNAFDALLKAVPELKGDVVNDIGWDSVGSCGSFDGRGLPWERLFRKFFPEFRPRPKHKVESCSEALGKAKGLVAKDSSGLEVLDAREGGVVLEYYVDLRTGEVRDSESGKSGDVSNFRRIVVVDLFTQLEGFENKVGYATFDRHKERGCWTKPYIELRSPELRHFAANRFGVDLGRTIGRSAGEDVLGGNDKKQENDKKQSPSFLSNTNTIIPENGLPTTSEDEKQLIDLKNDLAMNVREYLTSLGAADHAESAENAPTNPSTKTRPLLVLLALRLNQKKEPRAVLNLKELLLGLDNVVMENNKNQDTNNKNNNKKSIRFLVIDPGDLNEEEQIRLFLQTDVYIFIHGAAAANAIWMPRDSVVIEILPGNSWHCMFSFMQQAGKGGGVDGAGVVDGEDHDGGGKGRPRWNWIVSAAGSGSVSAGSGGSGSFSSTLDNTESVQVLAGSPRVKQESERGESTSNYLYFDTSKKCANHEVGYSDSQRDRGIRGKWFEARKGDGRFVGVERLGEVLRNVLRYGASGTTSGSGTSDIGFKDGLEESAKKNLLTRGACSGHAWELFETGEPVVISNPTWTNKSLMITSAPLNPASSSSPVSSPGETSPHRTLSRSPYPFLCESEMPTTPLPIPQSARKSGLVIVLNSLRSGEIAYPSFDQHVIQAGKNKGYTLDIALSVGSFAVSENNPFYKNAKYVWQIPDPVGGNWTENWLDVYNGCRDGGGKKDPEVSLKRFQRPVLNKEGKEGTDNGGIDIENEDNFDKNGRTWIMLNGIGERLTPPTFTGLFFKFVALQRILSLKLYEKYSFVIVTRADQLHLSDHLFSDRFSGGSGQSSGGSGSSGSSSGSSDSIIFPVQHQEWGGICDRHMVISMSHIIPAFSMLEPVTRGQFPPQNDDITKWEFKNTETFLYKFLKWRGLGIENKPSMERTMFTTCCRRKSQSEGAGKGKDGVTNGVTSDTVSVLSTFSRSSESCVELTQDRRYRMGEKEVGSVGISVKYKQEARAAQEVCVEKEKDRRMSMFGAKFSVKSKTASETGSKTAGDQDRMMDLGGKTGLSGCCCVDRESCQSDKCEVVSMGEGECVD